MTKNIPFSYKIIDEKNKKVEIIYNRKKLRLKLKIKRSFTVLKALLKEYPNEINIHSLDKILNDPNRAHSDLRNIDGFSQVLDERRGKKRVMYVRLNVDKLFRTFQPKDPETFVSLSILNNRATLTEKQKDKIFNEFNGMCNITGYKLHKKLPGNYFMKKAILAAYDHRIPLSKMGREKIENIQLISELANGEKNKICNLCTEKNVNFVH